MTVPQARLRLKIHARMTPRVATCFPSDPRYKERQLQCLACRQAGVVVDQRSKDTEEHIIQCEFYSHLRDGLDLGTDFGIVAYFQRVISQRAEIEN